VSNWIELEVISKDPYEFYEYAVYELYPASYKKFAIVLSLFRMLNSEVNTEIGYLNIGYPQIRVKPIKDSLQQFYFALGTKFLNKKIGDSLPWDITLATGIDVSTIGVFALENVWDETEIKDWQLGALEGMAIFSGAGCGYLQNHLKRKWIKEGDKTWKKIMKKAGAGALGGMLYELAMITGYFWITKDWEHNGDYMIRDFMYIFMVKAGCLGHLGTSIVF